MVLLKSRIPSLILFIALVVGGGISIGILTGPGEWYANLLKPWFNPPNWIFGPVWTVLYIFIAISGWRVWSHGSDLFANQLWAIQLVLNFLWSPTFFVAERPGWALFIISALLIIVLVFVRRVWTVDRLSSALFVPYAMWVSFAATLNASIFFLN